MGKEDAGLSLRGLAERLEALEGENERMRSENAELRGEVAALKGAATREEGPALRKAPEGPGREGAARPLSGSGVAVSRRAMLTKVGAAAVAALGAGVLLVPREAEAAQLVGDGDPGVRGIGTANGGVGVRGEIQSGINGHGVFGRGDGDNWVGVYGINSSSGGIGVYGSGYGATGTGVLGNNPLGIAVRGESSADDYASVYGQHLGFRGYGVIGDGKGDGSGVLGRNPEGPGVRGQGETGVRGEGSSGYGGLFEGGKAQLRVVPKGTAGRPSSGNHLKGEVYLDSAGALFVCTKGGTPGTWRKVTTTAA